MNLLRAYFSSEIANKKELQSAPSFAVKSEAKDTDIPQLCLGSISEHGVMTEVSRQRPALPRKSKSKSKTKTSALIEYECIESSDSEAEVVLVRKTSTNSMNIVHTSRLKHVGSTTTMERFSDNQNRKRRNTHSVGLQCSSCRILRTQLDNSTDDCDRLSQGLKEARRHQSGLEDINYDLEKRLEKEAKERLELERQLALLQEQYRALQNENKVMAAAVNNLNEIQKSNPTLRKEKSQKEEGKCITFTRKRSRNKAENSKEGNKSEYYQFETKKVLNSQNETKLLNEVELNDLKANQTTEALAFALVSKPGIQCPIQDQKLAMSNLRDFFGC